MPRYDAIACRFDGEKLEVLAIKKGQIVIIELSPERALQHGHDLIGHALVMMGRRAAAQ